MTPTLSPDEIMAARAQLSQGRDPQRIARRLGVSRAAIVALGRGLPWRHLVAAPEDLFAAKRKRPRR